MAKKMEMPPMAEQKPEEAQEAAPEMAMEEEISPEQESALEMSENIEQQRGDLMALEMQEGPPTQKEQKLLELLREQIALADDFGEIEELVE